MLVIGHAGKGDPVSVVYYFCEQSGGKCTPHDGLYYVHNGVASDDLPLGNGGAKVYHVPYWDNTTTPPEPHVDELHICAPEEAANPPVHVTCHESPVDGAGPKERWAAKAIYTYSLGTPITWITDDPKQPHNGVFQAFQEKSAQVPDSDITHFIKGTESVRLEGNLQFWHYVNVNPAGGETGRKARGWEKFTLQSEWVPCSPDKGRGKISFAKIKMRW